MPYQILVLGDCTEAMKRLPDASVHSVVCDPPYHLTSIVERFGNTDAAPVKVPEGGSGVYARSSKGFMGKVWDGGDVAFRVETWREVFRVLKPGGHLLAFGGTRTYHRMACAIEDAGFEIRDSIHYTYGSGFPKSHSVAMGMDKAARGTPQGSTKGDPRKRGKGSMPSREVFAMGGNNGGAPTGLTDSYDAFIPETEDAKTWKGWGTALKPSHEVIVLARRPLEGTVVKNVLAHGTGALNIDATRVPHGGDVDLDLVQRQQHSDGAIEGAFGAANLIGKEIPTYKPEGRWPANTLIQHSPGCGEECVEGCPVPVMDEQSGAKSASFVRNRTDGARPFNNEGKPTNYASTKVEAAETAGGASRYFNVFSLEPGEYDPFFYAPKAARKEREAGLGALKTEEKKVANDHPTVKSIALMEWCVKLVTPPEGVVLDPFMGSGSTGIAALRNDFNFIGIEADEHYMDIAEARITHWGGTPEVLR